MNCLVKTKNICLYWNISCHVCFYWQQLLETDPVAACMSILNMSVPYSEHSIQSGILHKEMCLSSFKSSAKTIIGLIQARGINLIHFFVYSENKSNLHCWWRNYRLSNTQEVHLFRRRLVNHTSIWNNMTIQYWKLLSEQMKGSNIQLSVIIIIWKRIIHINWISDWVIKHL